MVVLQSLEQAKRIVITLARIEYNDFISARVIVVLIESKELIHSQIRVHGTDAIEKHKRATVVILLRYMVDDTLMDVLHKVCTVCISCQRILGIAGLRGVCLFLLQLVFQHRGMLQELLLVEELAELIEEIQRQHIDV